MGFSDDVAGVEFWDSAEQEAEGDEEEDERGLLCAPGVVGVDEREGDGEEVKEGGAEGVGEGGEEDEWVGTEKGHGVEDGGARSRRCGAEDQVCAVGLDGGDFEFEELGRVGFADEVD